MNKITKQLALQLNHKTQNLCLQHIAFPRVLHDLPLNFALTFLIRPLSIVLV